MCSALAGGARARLVCSWIVDALRWKTSPVLAGARHRTTSKWVRSPPRRAATPSSVDLSAVSRYLPLADGDSSQKSGRKTYHRRKMVTVVEAVAVLTRLVAVTHAVYVPTAG
jgi:hypothetical protein